MTDRTRYANELVTRLRTFCERNHPGLIKVHWDDCDMEERTFWFHFHAPVLAKVRMPKSDQMRDASKLVRACWRETARFFAEEGMPYEWTMSHSKWDSPQAEYLTIDGRKVFDKYEDYTWIRVLRFYG